MMMLMNNIDNPTNNTSGTWKFLISKQEYFHTKLLLADHTSKPTALQLQGRGTSELMPLVNYIVT